MRQAEAALISARRGSYRGSEEPMPGMVKVSTRSAKFVGSGSSGEVAEPGLRRTPGERVNSEGFRGFKSPPLRHSVPDFSDFSGKRPKSARRRAPSAYLVRPEGAEFRVISVLNCDFSAGAHFSGATGIGRAPFADRSAHANPADQASPFFLEAATLPLIRSPVASRSEWRLGRSSAIRKSGKTRNGA